MNLKMELLPRLQHLEMIHETTLHSCLTLGLENLILEWYRNIGRPICNTVSCHQYYSQPLNSVICNDLNIKFLFMEVASIEIWTNIMQLPITNNHGIIYLLPLKLIRPKFSFCTIFEYKQGHDRTRGNYI